MAGKLGKFQMRSFNYWGPGVDQKNNLAAAFQLQPQRATNVMVQLLAYQRGASLDTFLNQFPVKEFENDEEYIWDIIGSSRRNIPLVEARDENGTTVTSASGNIGAGTAPFYLVFAENWFADGEIIVGNLNEVYQFRIKDHPKMEGTNYVYEVELCGANTLGCPAERLLEGEKFSVEFAPVEEELSRKVGDIRFATPVSMRNGWTTLRIYHKVAGSMLDRKMAVGIPVTSPGANGKLEHHVENMWMHYVDWEMEQEFSEEKNRALAFGRSNRNTNGEYMNFGKSGNVIKMGDGLFAQMEVANTTYYNKFSIKLLERTLLELATNKLGLQDRQFVIKTGQWGALQFNEAVKQETSGWYPMFILDNSSTGVVQKVSSPLHQNALAAGYQYTEFRAPNNITVSLDVDPLYDDIVRNKIQHPDGGPAMSYRYDIMYMGTMDQPNIFKCQIKGNPEQRGYRWGFRNPWTGQQNNPNMTLEEDAAEVHKMCTLGLVVLDPTRTVSMIPALLQG